MGLFSWFFGGKDEGRDGSTPEKAIIVGSVPEEYEWVGRNLPGYKFESQALLSEGGKPFDVLRLRGQNGEQREVFFDISSFFGR